MQLLLPRSYFHVVGCLARIYFDFVALVCWLLIRANHFTSIFSLIRAGCSVDMGLLCCLDCLLKISELVIVFFLFGRLLMLLGWLLVLVLIVVELLSGLADLILHKILVIFRFLLFFSLVVIWLRIVVLLCLDYLIMRLLGMDLLLRLNSLLVFEVLRLLSCLCSSKVVELILLIILFLIKSI